MLDLTTQLFSEEYAPPFWCIKLNEKISKRAGFTLFELALAVAIFGSAAVGTLSLYISCAALTESAGNITRMMNRARQELESVVFRRNFAALSSYSVVSPQPLAPLRNREMSVACYVRDHPTVSDLKEVRIVISYREKSNRIIGGDKDLDGVADPGDDINSDGELISPCEIATFITRKE